MVRDSGVNVLKWSLGGINDDFSETIKQVAYIQQMIEVHPAYFMQVRVPADMERAKREGKLGLILSFESVEMLEAKELVNGFGNRVLHLLRFAFDDDNRQTVHEQDDVRDDVVLRAEDAHLKLTDGDEAVVVPVTEVNEAHCRAFLARLAILAHAGVLHQQVEGVAVVLDQASAGEAGR